MHRYLSLVAILMAGSSLFLFVAYRIALGEQALLEEEYRHLASNQAQTVSWHMNSAFDTLNQLGVLFQGSESVSAEEFGRVAEGMLGRHREIRALEWIPVVPQAQRTEMEAVWRQRFPGFTFTELHDGVMVTARPRNFYYPVYYLAPLAGNERAFGFDLGSEPVRLNTLMQARDEGRLLSSASVQLVQGPSAVKAVLVFLPVYRGLPATLSNRRANLMGFVLGVFEVETMVQTVLFDREQSRIDFRLYDDSADGEVLLTVGQFDPSMAAWDYDLPLSHSGGRQWRFQARPQEAFFEQQRSLLPWAIALGGPLMMLLLVGMVHQLSQRNRAIAALVEERTQELDEVNRKLMQLSLTDSLTEVGNRRQFDHWLNAEWDAGRRTSRPLTLMLVDVDHFKAFNDNYGHRAGDKALRKIAASLKGRLNRPRDLVARYGGEEFAILLPESSDNVVVLAQALCDGITELGIRHEYGAEVGVVTVSIGVATLVPGSEQRPDTLVELADQALYRAKAEGRHRVVSYGGQVHLKLAP
ncbi:CHASE domain-containing protein [Ferrimonas balearica]|uniref:CHASE domain-containing protein n=1 Tax=Ferrimonas balearica TaxID=44012 RepID=UPI001C9A00E0|nr:CHASE domain-containing protein [Ferrimonas balearica]MBY5990678.1 CHASE domain-containing protein [Ferrimonas balearica]